MKRMQARFLAKCFGFDSSTGKWGKMNNDAKDGLHQMTPVKRQVRPSPATKAAVDEKNNQWSGTTSVPLVLATALFQGAKRSRCLVIVFHHW